MQIEFNCFGLFILSIYSSKYLFKILQFFRVSFIFYSDTIVLSLFFFSVTFVTSIWSFWKATRKRSPSKWFISCFRLLYCSVFFFRCCCWFAFQRVDFPCFWSFSVEQLVKIHRIQWTKKEILKLKEKQFFFVLVVISEWSDETTRQK